MEYSIKAAGGFGKGPSNKRKCPAERGWTERLGGQFSPEQISLAQQISNNISESMFAKESREDVHMAVAYYADLACKEAMLRAEAESSLELFSVAKALMDEALSNPRKP